MNMRSILTILFLTPLFLLAQPQEVKITDDGRLIYGGNPTEGFYDVNQVNKLEITLTEPDWFELMDGEGGRRGTPGISLIGTLTFNDTEVLDSVVVSIKGQTSDFRNESEKKSFKIEIDELKNQDLMGYDNLNLNCAFDDQSGMREVLYYDISRSFTPALKGCFVDLYINGQSWGPYNNIQQIEGTYIQEWFTDNDGTRWRAVTPDDVEGGGGAGGGGAFGTGVSTLNYNGPDSTDYNENYTLKKTSKDDPWQDLIDVCFILNSAAIEDLYDELKDHFDIDRAMWFLAQENIFSDDDSYIHKGGMDYYVYWDNATDRIIPMEVDGNSVMSTRYVSWDPFYHEDDPDFPLLNRLLQNTEVRQRYLAHVRTILKEYFVEEDVHNRIDEFASILDQRVQDDPKALYSYNEFLNGIIDLKAFVSNRIDFLSSYSEINREGLEISDLVMESPSGLGIPPRSQEEVEVRVQVESSAQKVILYYGLALDGAFDRIEMFDDGMHNDLLSGDGIYGASIPGFSHGNYVRYYVEAIKDDGFSTASYYPEGAEHDVFIYQVQASIGAPEDVVINEFMASNDSAVEDNMGEFDDWIELYNKGDEAVDLSGYFLSDDEGEITKWEFPENTIIDADDYLIIWADDDEEQTTDEELHANFKLSAGGEMLILANAVEEIIDQVDFDEQQTDVSFARIPNGVGDFQFRTETFDANNDGTTTESDDFYAQEGLEIYPNPAYDFINLDMRNIETKDANIRLYNAVGKLLIQRNIEASASITTIDIGQLAEGIYFISLQDQEQQEAILKKFVKLR